MEKEGWGFLIVHYLVLAGVIWLSFAYLMSSNIEVSDLGLFGLFFVIISVMDTAMHKAYERWG